MRAYKYISVSKNKSLELQVSRWKDAKFFDYEFFIRRNQDHAGFTMSLTLFYHELSIDFYDNRHLDEYR